MPNPETTRSWQSEASTEATAAPGITMPFDILTSRGKDHASNGEWEYALRAYNSALNLVPSSSPSRNDQTDWTSRHNRLLKDIAYANRCIGRTNLALSILEPLLSTLHVSDPLRLNITGEVGVIYRSLGRLEEAKNAFEMQLELAREMQDDQRLCRAVGNLGMLNYQLALNPTETEVKGNREEQLLDLAEQQLQERISRAGALRKAYAEDSTSPNRVDYAATLEVIGLSRLSLCQSAREHHVQAVDTAKKAVELATTLWDPTVEAISRFFYGRALYQVGKKDEALQQFDLPRACSPAVALCKEPSAENCSYLQELVDSGADMDIPDENGYIALDYAVFNDNKHAQSIILDYLAKKISSSTVDSSIVPQRISQRMEEATLRKTYREIFQDQMRPVLLSASRDSIHLVRQTYSQALDASPAAKLTFDPLKFVPYTSFLAWGKFPRSTDNLTQTFSPLPGSRSAQHIVLISYRWTNRDPWARYPDDDDHNQYARIVSAMDEYLSLRSTIRREDVGIWIDYACVDQDSPMKGITALPISIAQCDAVISLVDDKYYERAWCCIEVMMIQALQKAYGIHAWFEYVDEGGNMVLRPGPEDLEARPSHKELRFESDMDRVRFLERQCRLLC